MFEDYRPLSKNFEAHITLFKDLSPVGGLKTHVHYHSMWHKAVQLMNIKHNPSVIMDVN